MQRLTVPAYGKINLALDVVGRRPDGYHLLRMVMQQVEFCDTVTLSCCQGPSQLHMNPPCPQIPQTQNMAWLALEQLNRLCPLPTGIIIEIQKSLPMAAGLAGGSADAAAVLQGVVQLLRLPYSLEQLEQTGLTLGADVPYCLAGGTMLAEGVGERLTPLPPAPLLWAVLANPGIAVDTAEIFRHFRLEQKGEAPDIDGMIAALRQQNIPQLLACQGNVLESVTLKRYPQVAKLKRDLNSCGIPALMSGSGGTVFGLTSQRQEAEAAVAFLRARYPWVVLTKLHTP